MAYSVNLLLQGPNTMPVCPMSKKVQLIGSQYTLGWVHYYAVGFEAVTNFVQMFQVLFLGGAAGYKNVVNVVVGERKST